jgi:hypothetical protein
MPITKEEAFMFSAVNTKALCLTAAILLGLSGCSQSNPTTPEFPMDPINDPYTDPGAQYPGAPGPTYPGAPGGQFGTPGYQPPTTQPDMTATVLKKKDGFLGLGKFRVTVEVVNPGNQPRTGKLTVTFMAGSKTSKTAPTQQTVSLAANETKTFDFEDTRWATNGATADIVTDPLMGAPASGGFGGAGAYGAGGFGAPTTPAW